MTPEQIIMIGDVVDAAEYTVLWMFLVAGIFIVAGLTLALFLALAIHRVTRYFWRMLINWSSLVTSTERKALRSR